MCKPRLFRFGTGAFRQVRSLDSFVTQARKIEDMGYSIYLVPDHFEDVTAPLITLMAAASATSLRVGTFVCANDFRHPAVLAKEAATLDLLSDGRLELGLGAGWLEADYIQTGIPFDPPGVRVSRLIEAIQIIKGLFREESFTFLGEHYTIRDMEGWPQPVQRPHPPIVIGASGRRMLSMAAREADIIGLLVPSHGSQLHLSGGTSAAVAERIDWVRQAAADRFEELEFNVLILDLLITEDRQQGAEQIARARGLTPEQVLDNVHILVGSVDQIVDDLQMRRERFGISYITVDHPFRNALAPIVSRLAGT